MSETLPAPKSRKENILGVAAGAPGSQLPADGPKSREEQYLFAIAEGGGGGGGTTDYDKLNNKPQINGTTLSGNKTTAQLGLAPGTLTGASDPTTSTAGTVGQFYLNTDSGDLFICSEASGGTYVWLQVNGGGGSIAVTGVEITQPASDTDLYIGSSNIALEATISPAAATNKNITWSSSDTSKIDIVYNAQTTGFEAQAVANGAATITVTTEDGSFTDTVTITAKTHVTGVTVSPASASPILNSTQQLTATIAPADATDKTGTWTSSDTTVATVDSNGLVTAKAEGTATITFTTTDGSFTGTSTITPVDQPTTWTAIQSAVQAGKAADYWSVGDEISVACPWTDPSSNTQYSWVWVVADIGTTYKESAPDTAVPCMTLIAKYLTPSNYMFDNTEKVEATEATAVDGVYYYGFDGSSTYTKLSLNTGDTIPYGDYTKVYKNSVNMSSGYDVQYGYNNWKYSNIRQWLNSAGSAGNWFTPSHVGDAAPNYSSQAGFLSGFSAEFQSVLTPTRSGVAANTVTDGGTTYYTYDKMFLPSGYEVHTNTSLTDEGPVFALYANAQNADRVKYRLDNQSSASNWWLRSPNRNVAYDEYNVSYSGGSNSNTASNNTRVAPACRIC